MAIVDLIMPKMGESIMEATILSWVKQVGDQVEEDETVLEIATDKVDSEIPSPIDGVITEILFKENDVVPVGTVIAKISTEGENTTSAAPVVAEQKPQPAAPEPIAEPAKAEMVAAAPKQALSAVQSQDAMPTNSNSGRFYSPLVRSIAKQEKITAGELDSISGSGANGRVNKKDILQYIESRKAGDAVEKVTQSQFKVVPTPAHSNGSNGSNAITQKSVAAPKVESKSIISDDSNVEIIEMDRMRRLIANHMVDSKRTSPHVTSFIEADVTHLVNWRNKVKKPFQEKYGQKITFTPLFVDAVIKALSDYPMVNVSVDGNNIIRKKYVNIGMATALPSGNLIVPVIKDANGLNLVGLTQKVNDLAARARSNKLKPEEIQDGTFTLTNVGTFGNVMGTPIINQPQAAILATGAIRKKPAVLETEFGDVIAIRQMMFMSLSYDHRVVDGFLGGSFLRRVADYLENFDDKQVV